MNGAEVGEFEKRFKIIKFFKSVFKQNKCCPSGNEQEFNQIPILLQEDSSNTQHEYSLDEAVRATSK